MSTIKEATAISIEAIPGKGDELAEFLSAGGALVKENEPETIHWFALRQNTNSFVVFDTFNDASGRARHFSGKVALALKDKAKDLILGGWDEGVVKKIQNYEILSNNG